MQEFIRALPCPGMAPPPPGSLADRLRHVLATTGLKAATLSKQAGLAPGHVGLILSGTVKGGVTPETMQRLASAAGVDYGWLATGEGSPEPGAAPVEPIRAGTGVEPVLASVETWPSVLGAARRMAPEVPFWVWDTLGRSRPWLDQPLTPALAVALARVIEAHVPPPTPHKRATEKAGTPSESSTEKPRG